MHSILESCLPREELLNGTFNPEIFTAALSAVIKHYRAEPSAIDRIYTDADAFFTQATFPTQGLVKTVSLLKSGQEVRVNEYKTIQNLN